MSQKNWLVLVPVTVLAASAMLACEQSDGSDEDEGCATNDDCASGEVCAPAEGSGEAAACIAGTACTDDAACTGGFSCTMPAGRTDGWCASSCTETAGCTGGYECNAETNTCEMPPTWPFVAIVSATTTEGDINDTNTPGPDIDAIEIQRGGASTWAAVVEKAVDGAGGNADGNVNADESTVLGANDAIPAADGTAECSLADGEDALFYSLGSGSDTIPPIGVLIVSFGDGFALADADTLNVWEVSTTTCSNVSTERTDSYEVWIGNSDVDPTAVTGAADIQGENWRQLGTSEAGGGIFSGIVSIQ